MADISIIHEGSTDYYVKDAAGRLALAEVVNMGAKNKIYNKIHNVGESVTAHGFTFTQQDDGGIKIEYASTDSEYSDYYMAGTFYGTAIQFDLSDDDYAMSLTTKTAVSSEISNKIRIRLYDRTVSPELKTHVYLNSTPMIFSPHATVVFITIYKPISNFPAEGIVVYPMICTKAEWDISQAYVPYGKTNAELTSDISALSTENTRQETEIGVVANAGAKNLLNPDDYIKNSTGGLTITETGTGTYKITGTPSGTVDIFTTQSGKFDMMYGLEAGKTYTISGLPEGNGLLCRIDVSKNNSGSWNAQIISNLTLPQTFTVPSDATGLYIRYRVTTSAMIPSGGISLEPMIRPASITDSTFVPYAKTNVDLTNENANQQLEIDYAINAGVKNLFPITASGTQTIGGVVFTVNSDGTITANGTKTNNDWFILSENNSFDAGTYTLSDGLPVDTTDCLLIIATGLTLGSAIMLTSANARPQTKKFNTAQTGLYYAIRISNGKTVSNLTFKPMIRPAAITDNTFVPYALSNPVITPALIAQVDGVAKNRLNYHLATFGDKSKITINQDGSITGSITSDTRQYTWANREFEFKLPAGDYAFLINRLAGDGAYTSARLMTAENANICSVSANPNIAPSMRSFTLNTEATIGFIGKVFTDTIQLMLCTAADWAVSQKFVPYSLPNPTLTPAVIKAVDEGAKNLVNAPNGSGVRFINIPIVLQPGDYYVLFQNISSTDTDAATCQFGAFHEDDSQASNFPQLKRGDNTGAMFSVSKQTSYVRVYASSSFAGGGGDTVTFTGCMICTKAEWDISHEYKPYALPNPTLTPAAIKAVDEGAKNLLEITATTQTINGVTFTVNADQTITVNGTNNTQGAITCMFVSNDRAIKIPDGEYILSGCPQGGGPSTYDLRWYLYSSGKSAYDNGSGATVNKSGNTTSSNIAIIIRAGVTVSNLIFKPMICTAADWAVSKKFVPYAPSNRELYEKVDGLGTELVANTNLNNLNIGTYYCGGATIGATLLNSPTHQPFRLIVSYFQSPTNMMQKIIDFNTSTSEIAIYIRVKTSSGWKSWYKFEGTEVT